MRHAAALAVALTCVLLSGCGGSGGASAPPPGARSDGRTLESLWQEPGMSVGITAGSANFEPGPVRFSFIVLDRQGRQIVRPSVRVWVSTALDAAPILATTATLERAGVPGGEQGLAGTFYVSHFTLGKPGKYWLLANLAGGKAPVHALGNVIVQKHDPPPDVGDRAIASDTPTIASTGGDLARLTTRVPPDVSMLRYSIADSLKAHVPFVVTFATPKFCTSRTCGPTVDVVLAAQKRFRRDGVRFVHVEVYEGNDPAKGPNRWMKEWSLDTEPWVFLVDRKGRIARRFEGVVSLDELEQAIRDELVS
jgi:hypothetical protein